MYKIKFQNARIFAKKIEIKYPDHDFENGVPLEYDIYAHGLRLGTTKNRVLNFQQMLQDAYELEKNWHTEVKDVNKHQGIVVPEYQVSQGQVLLMIANNCPSEEPLGEKTDKCWNRLKVSRLNDWMAVPHHGGDSDIKNFAGDHVIGEWQN